MTRRPRPPKTLGDLAKDALGKFLSRDDVQEAFARKVLPLLNRGADQDEDQEEPEATGQDESAAKTAGVLVLKEGPDGVYRPPGPKTPPPEAG